MRYKIENLADVEDAKNFINQYKESCSYKLLRYSMYLIVLTLFTIIIWSRYAKKDIVVNAFGVINAKENTCDIFIENTSIGSIQKDKDVRIEVVSLSRNDYGVLTSKIEEVSDDVVVDSGNGRKYYNAKCPLDKTIMTSKSGEEVRLRNGMEAKISIICNRTTYFDYILNKLVS